MVYKIGPQEYRRLKLVRILRLKKFNRNVAYQYLESWHFLGKR